MEKENTDFNVKELTFKSQQEELNRLTRRYEFVVDLYKNIHTDILFPKKINEELKALFFLKYGSFPNNLRNKLDNDFKILNNFFYSKRYIEEEKENNFTFATIKIIREKIIIKLDRIYKDINRVYGEGGFISQLKQVKDDIYTKVNDKSKREMFKAISDILGIKVESSQDIEEYGEIKK